jgi:hypothetical protein
MGWTKLAGAAARNRPLNESGIEQIKVIIGAALSSSRWARDNQAKVRTMKPTRRPILKFESYHAALSSLSVHV